MATEEKEPNYIIVAGRSVIELVGYVNMAIDKGYLPIGGIETAQGSLIQGMVRRELFR